MNSKKKLIIALCSVSVVAVGFLAALIGVLAAFNATSESSYNIQYTAKNVKATIAAEYKVGSGNYTTLKCGSNDIMTFTGSEEDEEVTQTFASLSKTNLAYNEDVVIHYTIKNTGTNAFKVTSASSFTNNNFTVTYATSEDSTTWASTIAEVGNVDSVGADETLELYVKISITTKTKDASLTGNTSFVLDIIQ